MTKETTLIIEEVTYDKMIIRDVNNYQALYHGKPKVKLKGDFEIDKEYHKDPSMRIVPLAVKEYFINGTPIEETIRNHKDIYDFCLRLKTNSLSTGMFRYLNDDGIIVEKELQRTTRYYVGNGKKAGMLFKKFHDGKISGVNVGFSAILFNKYEEKEMKDYNIDYDFYIAEANKLRYAVSTGQLSLF